MLTRSAHRGTRRVGTHAWQCVIMFIVAGCSVTSESRHTERTGHTASPQRCEADRDCRIIREACCDCEGQVQAVSEAALVSEFQACVATTTDGAGCHECALPPGAAARVARCTAGECTVVAYSDDELVSCVRDDECEARPRSGCGPCQPRYRRTRDTEYPDTSSWIAVNRLMPNPGTIQPGVPTVACPAAECPNYAGLTARCERSRCTLAWRHRGDDGDAGAE